MAADEVRRQAPKRLDELPQVQGDGGTARREGPLPDSQACVELLRMMLLIRRFEERSGEMYMRAKIGGFLHLAVGEEATIVGTVSAMRTDDYLLSTYREHGQALARGVPPAAVMAELFGRVDGCCRGRGGSMHLFDADRRLMGGYGIVGANLPIAAGMALACDYRGTDEVTVCMFGDGATNQGTFGETMNMAALWGLPILFVCVNNQFGMGTALERHSAVTDLSKKSACLGVPGDTVDGMDVLAVRQAVAEHLDRVRESRQPAMIEALTYRFHGHSIADPQEYRTEQEVERWRQRDPITLLTERLTTNGIVDANTVERLDAEVQREVEEAVRSADESPDPPLESLYDDVYVLGDQVQGWYLVDERGPSVHRGEQERTVGLSDTDRELAEAGAAYSGVGERRQRELRRRRADQRAAPERSGNEQRDSEAPAEDR